MFIKNTILVGIFTLISRIFGYIRDVIIAQKLGASIYNDIFIIAFRIPNLFRNIFGEGAFNASFIPIYSVKLEDNIEAKRFVTLIHTYLTCGLILFCTALFIFMPIFVEFTLPGFKDEEAQKIVILCSRIMLPYLLLISLVAFYGGILNSHAKYMPFAVAPILLNIILIIFALFGDSNIERVHLLSIGVVVAGMVELIWMLFFIKKANLTPGFLYPRFNSNIKIFVKKFIPGVIGSGVTQINILVDSIIASYIVGGISYLYYADRVNQLPLALIGTACGVVILPILSKNFKNGNKDYAIRLHNQALNFLLLITIPCTFALQVLSSEIIHLLFERGAFSSEAVEQTSKALRAFAIGLPAYTLIRIFVTNFYANGDTKTPVKIAACCILSNVIISLLLLNFIQHVGIALASSISAWFNLISMWYILSQRGWFMFDITLNHKILKYVVASVLMSIFLVIFKNKVSIGYHWLVIMIASIIYMVMIILLKAITIDELRSFFKR